MKSTLQLGKLITREHERKWVALSPDYKSIVSFDEKLAPLKERVGTQAVVYMRVPPSDVYHTF